MNPPAHEIANAESFLADELQNHVRVSFRDLEQPIRCGVWLALSLFPAPNRRGAFRIEAADRLSALLDEADPIPLLRIV